ncbi:putative Translationally-controlled tumor protein [Penicillium antarcticum]|uniref:putative Translationally-controlled tumor protein n=1 Tax=Penicillium antarcticum TaxID=416450 RepID=UPI0023A07AD5|nr:putative Translationally-controlled tumor protein [Penicillium antarcticum]KAJ5319941.1 putative Translationally-controlled tumor protein [Penicillium antarcticum]
MVKYRDIVSGEILATDEFILKDVNGAVWEIDCKEILAHKAERWKGVFPGSKGKVWLDYLYRFGFQRLPHSGDARLLDLSNAASAWASLQKMRDDTLPDSTIEDMENRFTYYYNKIFLDPYAQYSEWYATSFESISQPILVREREDGTPYAILWQLAIVKEY